MGNYVNDKGKLKKEASWLMPVLRKIICCKMCVHLPILIDQVGN